MKDAPNDEGVMFRRPRGLLALLVRSRSSPEAFADFYDEALPSVIAFHRSRTNGDDHRAFDLSHDTFLKAFERRDQFTGASDEDATRWLFKIARNAFADSGRSRQKDKVLHERLGFQRPPPAVDDQFIAEHLKKELDINKQLQEALEQLSAEQIEVLRLRFGQNLKYPEIAERLGISHTVARKRASRALTTLRKTDQMLVILNLLES